MAANLLTEVVNELSSGSPANLVAAVRRLLHASELLGWDDAAVWWKNELNGWSDTDAPDYRHTNASIDFRSPLVEMYASMGTAARPSLAATIQTVPLTH